MQLFFSDKSYYTKAKELVSKEIDTNDTISNIDCFFIVINGLGIGDLNILCNSISSRLNISLEESYLLTQQLNNNPYKELIFSEALKLILDGICLGDATDGKFNTSSWINHSVNEAILAYNLATIIDINANFAFNYALLHDYGRKYVHDFSHVIKGFESLIDLGILKESRACLTHSFINGGRYCCMETAPNDFYIDDNHKECYKDKDEISEVLDDSSYNDYDDILNIADLMAMSSGVVSPEIRIKDILTRRKNFEEALNWPYFLKSFYNLILKIMNKMNIMNNYEYITDNNKYSVQEIKDMLCDISKFFFDNYKSIMSNCDYDVDSIDYKDKIIKKIIDGVSNNKKY